MKIAKLKIPPTPTPLVLIRQQNHIISHMRGNTFGEVLTVTVAGESHGPQITAIVDGVPAGLPLTEADIQRDLDRRRPGQNEFTTPRDESDTVAISSGVYGGETTGTPIALHIPSHNTRSEDYDELRDTYRPGHADSTYDLKYGLRDPDGGGRSSFRVFAGVVAAGAVAKRIIPETKITAYVDQIGPIRAYVDDVPTEEMIEASPLRCPEPDASDDMERYLQRIKTIGDSTGGVVAFIIENAGLGLGEPIFGKLQARLGAALLSINATTGVQFGAGFSAPSLRGSEYNDPILGLENNSIKTTTNNAGGSLGGISTGMPIFGRVAFRPTSSIAKEQSTISRSGAQTTIYVEGRHDPCVVPRAVPAVEAMATLVVADLTLLRRLDR